MIINAGDQHLFTISPFGVERSVGGLWASLQLLHTLTLSPAAHAELYSSACRATRDASDRHSGGSERERVGLWERSAMQLDRAKMVALLLLLSFAFC